MQSLDQFLQQADVPTESQALDPMIQSIMNQGPNPVPPVQAPVQQPQQQVQEPKMTPEQWMQEFQQLQTLLTPKQEDVNIKPEENIRTQGENKQEEPKQQLPLDNIDELIKQAQEYQTEAETKIADLEFKNSISDRRIKQLEQMVEAAMGEKMTIAQKVDLLSKDYETLKAQQLPDELSALSQYWQVYKSAPQSVATQHRIVSELSKIGESITGRKFDQYLEDRLSGASSLGREPTSAPSEQVSALPPRQGDSREAFFQNLF